MSNGYNVFPANKSLFRAKRKDNNEWLYWNIYGELCRVSGKRTRLAITKGAGTSYYDFIHQIRHLLIPKTIGRFTALNDKNGKKVFEGDIVVLRACRPHEVIYSNGGFELVGTAIPIRNVDRFELIGNIHDNPELMEN
ncbi:MAG: hypothetical protein IJ341_02160 [Bacteroidales bacterium]|nr:hypothetical protein [Bacteroidales bacterium]